MQSFEEAHPNVKVNLTSYTSEVYKEKFPQLLNSQVYDVLYWHAGERLFEFIEQGKIASLNPVFSNSGMSKMFDQTILDSVSINNQVYALPLSYYQLGFYYYQPLFTKFGLNEPQTWSEFLSLCATLKQNNITPIYIGTETNWPATAWFDYLNLRLNGIEFHMALMRGEASYLDAKVSQVLQKIYELSKAGYFIQDHQDLDWKQGLPLLFRGLVGMSMLGNYAMQDFPARIKNQMGFFKFPMLTDTDVYYEEVPLDVFIMPQQSKNSLLGEQFMRFAAQSDVQEKFNSSQNVLSPHKDAQQNNSDIVQEAYETISQANGVTRYFDRDSKKAYADEAMPLIDAFMVNLDIKATQQALEQVRLKHFASTLSTVKPKN